MKRGVAGEESSGEQTAGCDAVISELFFFRQREKSDVAFDRATLLEESRHSRHVISPVKLRLGTAVPTHLQ